ncbi:MAG TPA: SgcJ/EcaC family oxidoreductase [Xanthobacteraceae bacterium]|nr:SgcJ/EcaC family oxidoreductase [Xanthobacteraceae bacterium]
MDDDRAIRELVSTWINASKSGDLSTVLSLIADDAIFMVPGQPPFGKDAFAAASQGRSNIRVEGRRDIEEIRIIVRERD